MISRFRWSVGHSSRTITKLQHRWHGHSHDHSHCHGHSHSGSHSHAHGGHDFSEVGSEALKKECRRVTLVGGFSNVSMAAVKIWLGSAGGSYALLADGVHALVDFVSDVVSYGAVALTSVRIARCRFPFGIGRVETTGAVIVSAILLLGGLGLMIASIQRLISYFTPSTTLNVKKTSDHGGECQHHEDDDHGHSHGGVAHGHSHFEVMSHAPDGREFIIWEMVAVAALSLVIKEWLFRWTKKVGERAHSRVVVANAYHHRADAWSSGVALIGVGGYLIGMPILDAVSGFAVSLSIAKIGFDLFYSSVLEFFDFQYVHDVSRLQSSTRGAVAVANPPVVNIFATRHGHSYVLHGSLIVKPVDTVSACDKSVQEILAAASSAIKVSDHYFNFIRLPSQETIDSSAESRVSAFLAAAKALESFHGFAVISVTPTTEAISSGALLPCRILVQHCGLGHTDGDCLDDLRTLAKTLGIDPDIHQHMP